MTVGAWKHLFHCAKVEHVAPPAAGITLSLHLYQTFDNPDYAWLPPAGGNSCANCKAGVAQIWLDND